MTDEIMTVEELRLLMPSTAEHLSDNQMQALLDNLEHLASSVINIVLFE